MATLLPPEPRFSNKTEQVVCQRLMDGLRDEDVVLSGQRLTDDTKDHEADLVVLMPGIGILVVEVKGGTIWHDGELWWHGAVDNPRRSDPVTQVRDCKYAIRTYVTRDPRWANANHVAWGHAVVTPHSSFPDDFSLPDLPRWALHDRGDQEDLVDRLVTNAKRFWQGKQPPTQEQVDTIVEILQGRRVDPDPTAASEERAERAELLTLEQANLLGVTRLLNRVEVRGGAGSGKTVLALQQARDLSRGREDRPPQRVALLCYSIGLAEYLKREVATWPRRQRPAFVGTFHDLGRLWGAPAGDRTDSNFWEVELPQLMAELVLDQPDGHKFDAVIVDESQDFADTWWPPVLGALRDPDAGGLFVYSDENQRIFARFGRPPVALVPLVLDHNLRNTKQIHQAFGPLAPSRMYARGGDGPSVRFVPCDREDALSVADDEVERLLDEWPPEHVCLLTTGHRHPVQVERAEFHDQDGYWRTFWDTDDVFYGHVLGCKGLERRVVVLCVNQKRVGDRDRERLYVGMSRATDVLVVVGDPAMIAEIGGTEVAARLGITIT